jgi:hypothetical protein
VHTKNNLKSQKGRIIRSMTRSTRNLGENVKKSRNITKNMYKKNMKNFKSKPTT